MADNSNNNNSVVFNSQQGFTKTQWQKLQALIVEEIAAAQSAQSEHSYQYEQELRDCHCQNWSNSDNNKSNNSSDEKSADTYYDRDDKCFHSEEVGFFNPHLDSKNYRTEDIIDVSEKTYFWDVHLFIDLFKDVTHIKAEGVVCQNLNKCLQGVAQNWYIDQLSEIEQDHVCEEPEIEHWEKWLFKQFKCTQSSALKALKLKRYTIQDTQNNCKTSDFVLNVIQHTKDAGMNSTSAQLIWAWNCLNSSLHKSISHSMSFATISTFIETLKNMKEVWFNKYNRHTEPARPFQPPQQQPPHRQGNNFVDNCLFHQYSQFSGPSSYFSRPSVSYYQNNTYNWLY